MSFEALKIFGLFAVLILGLLWVLHLVMTVDIFPPPIESPGERVRRLELQQRIKQKKKAKWTKR